MKYRIISSFIVFFLLSYSQEINAQIYLELAAEAELTFDEIISQTELYFEEVGREKGNGYKPFRRWQYEMQRSLGPDGKIVSKSRQLESYKDFFGK